MQTSTQKDPVVYTFNSERLQCFIGNITVQWSKGNRWILGHGSSRSTAPRK